MWSLCSCQHKHLVDFCLEPAPDAKTDKFNGALGLKQHNHFFKVDFCLEHFLNVFCAEHLLKVNLCAEHFFMSAQTLCGFFAFILYFLTFKKRF